MNNAAIRALTLSEVRAALAAGDLTAEAVVRAALEQAERFHKAYALFITFTPDLALEQARAADRTRAAGTPLGALHGVPITIKDNIEMAGSPATAGSRVLANRIPREDATVVKKLKAAGAISLGQTNMHEMALGGTSTNPHYGAVRNPWDRDRIPGGSSGGAAACVSLQIGYAALGTDSGGSVRMPAAFCGLVGLKPTHGLVSLQGCVPTGVWNTDHIGPLTRTVADAALMLSVMQGYDPQDPDSVDCSPAPYPTREDLAGIKVGIPKNYFWEALDSDVERVCRQALEVMRGAGAELIPLRLETAELVNMARSALMAEAFVFHEPYLRERAEEYGEDVRYRLLAAQYVLATDFVRATRVRRLIMDEFSRVLDQVDVLVTPTNIIPAPPIGAKTVRIGDAEVPLGATAGISVFIRNTSPLNLTGHPAISIPAGLTRDGLPVGLQLVAAAFQDQKLLAIAAVIEKRIGFDPTPPLLRETEAIT